MSEAAAASHRSLQKYNTFSMAMFVYAVSLRCRSMERWQVQHSRWCMQQLKDTTLGATGQQQQPEQHLLQTAAGASSTGLHTAQQASQSQRLGSLPAWPKWPRIVRCDSQSAGKRQKISRTLVTEVPCIPPPPTASEAPHTLRAQLLVAVHGHDWDETAYILSRSTAHRQLLGYEYAVSACSGAAELLGPFGATLVLLHRGKASSSHYPKATKHEGQLTNLSVTRTSKHWTILQELVDNRATRQGKMWHVQQKLTKTAAGALCGGCTTSMQSVVWRHLPPHQLTSLHPICG